MKQGRIARRKGERGTMGRDIYLGALGATVPFLFKRSHCPNSCPLYSSPFSGGRKSRDPGDGCQRRGAKVHPGALHCPCSWGEYEAARHSCCPLTPSPRGCPATWPRGLGLWVQSTSLPSGELALLSSPPPPPSPHTCVLFLTECSFPIFHYNHDIYLLWKCEIHKKVGKKRFQNHYQPLQLEITLLNFGVFLSSCFCDY